MRRKQIWNTYDAHLREWACSSGVQTPVVPETCEQPYHMYYLLLPSLDTRQAFINTLRKQGIYSVFHYLPLHLSEMGMKFGGKQGDCPVTEDISDRLVRLPFYNTLTPEDQTRVIEAILHFCP